MAGFLMIEKVLTSSDTSDAIKNRFLIKMKLFNTQVIIMGTKTLSGLTRGTNAVFRGANSWKYYCR